MASSYNLELDVDVPLGPLPGYYRRLFFPVRRHEAGPANYKTGNEYELLSESPSRRGTCKTDTAGSIFGLS